MDFGDPQRLEISHLWLKSFNIEGSVASQDLQLLWSNRLGCAFEFYDAMFLY
jgi:hypothetical protein